MSETNILPFPRQLIDGNADQLSDHELLMAGKLRAAQFLNEVATGRNRINTKAYEALKGMNEILAQQGYPLAINPEELEKLRIKHSGLKII